MPGNTTYTAFQAFVSPLASALSCLAHTKLQCGPLGKSALGVTHLLFTNRGEYVPLPGPTLLEFRFRMHYELIKDDRPGFGPFRATTKSYDYSLRKTGGASVLDYHWHPSGRSHEKRPHVHLGSAQLRPDAVLSNKVHLLSGRATLESVLRTAIDLGARPLRDDWSDRLTEAEGPHLLYRSWA